MNEGGRAGMREGRREAEKEKRKGKQEIGTSELNTAVIQEIGRKCHHNALYTTIFSIFN